ncbi:hypothetical protein JW960_25125 [candidate division KSB1 bacterium]|nr:hypothetical protein [candidate division KSB1 bacterium]
MKKVIRQILGIQKGEGRITSIMFMYVFLLIATLLIVKPVRNSLFISHFGVAKLPYAFLSVALFAAIITHLYSKFMDRLHLNRLISLTTWVSIGCLIGFWLLLRSQYQAGWFYYVFYIWVALYGAISTSQFWLIANYVFDARQAKRLFGVVGAGAICGGIFGGYLTKFLAPVTGTGNMLLICILFLIGCIFIIQYVWFHAARSHYRERRAMEKRSASSYAVGSNPFSIIFRSRHLHYLSGIIGVSVIVANLVDYQFSAIASDVIQDKDQLTAFFGFWLSNLSIASLFVQLLFTTRVLKLLGVTTSLFFLPGGILIGALAILFQPALWSAILIKVSDGSFKQSINKAGLELLALPIPSIIKNRTKTFMDVFVDSIATGIGGILLIVLTSLLGLPVSAISLLVIALVVVWCFWIVRVRPDYLNAFRLALEKRSINLADQRITPDDASLIATLEDVLKGDVERHLLYALQLTEQVGHEKFLPHLKRLLNHSSALVRQHVIRNLRAYTLPEISDSIRQHIYDTDFDVQIEAICFLQQNKGNNTLIFDLFNDADYRVRSAALRCLARAYREDSEFREQIDIKQRIDQFLDQCFEREHDAAHIQFMKRQLATVIGVADEPDLHGFLTNLLHDPDPKVVKAAITSAGLTKDQRFIQTLIHNLRKRSLRPFARTALAAYGESAIPKLAAFLEDPKNDRNIRQRIPRVLSLICIQESVDVLINNMKQSDLHIRYEIIRALNKLKVSDSSLKFDKSLVLNYIYNETELHYRLLTVLHHQQQLPIRAIDKNLTIEQSKAVQQARRLLCQAIEEKLDQNLERIFRLLGLRYPASDVYNSYLGIISKRADLRANAVEFLDNLLDFHLKTLIIPLVEQTSIDALLQRTEQLYGFHLPTPDATFPLLLQGNDNWIKMCTLHYMTQLRYTRHKEITRNLLTDPDPFLQSTAQAYFQTVFPSEAPHADNR